MVTGTPAPLVVLGIWDGHDAGVALIAEGRLLFALAEERPTRRKRCSGFPSRSLDLCLAWADARGLAVSDVAIAGRFGRAPLRLLDPIYASTDPDRDPLGAASLAIQGWENQIARVPVLREVERALGLRALAPRIAARLGRRPRLHTVAHHEAHAWSALLGAGDEPALVVTWDAYGEGVSATSRDAAAPWEAEVTLGVSAGLASLYGAVCSLLGFAEGEEGKVMGLAALGDPHAAPRFRALFSEQDGAPRLLRPLGKRQLRGLLEGLSREDAAAALQRVTEEIGSRWIQQRLSAAGGQRRLLLAGGLFANVLLNGKLAALPEVSSLFVFPNMVDGGLAAGAAHRVWAERTGRRADPLRSALLGCAFSDTERRRAAEASGLPVRRLPDVALAAARHLRAGRVVCRHEGRDELGPRALGARSLLFSAADPALVTRVNDALRRDTFMPFGPLLRDEDAAGSLRSRLPLDDLRTMTVVSEVSEAFRRACPGAVHVDGTARPQLVSATSDPGLHHLLTLHREAGGGPAVVNTSFNLHGEPIVHTPEDALRTFLASGLDVLLLGDLELLRPGLSIADR